MSVIVNVNGAQTGCEKVSSKLQIAPGVALFEAKYNPPCEQE